MLKAALIGGLLAALSLSGFSLGDLLLGLIGVAVALLALALMIEAVAENLERLARRRHGLNQGVSVRMQRSRSAT